jgi:hypothetical protein
VAKKLTEESTGVEVELFIDGVKKPITTFAYKHSTYTYKHAYAVLSVCVCVDVLLPEVDRDETVSESMAATELERLEREEPLSVRVRASVCV